MESLLVQFSYCPPVFFRLETVESRCAAIAIPAATPTNDVTPMIKRVAVLISRPNLIATSVATVAATASANVGIATYRIGLFGESKARRCSWRASNGKPATTTPPKTTGTNRSPRRPRATAMNQIPLASATDSALRQRRNFVVICKSGVRVVDCTEPGQDPDRVLDWGPDRGRPEATAGGRLGHGKSRRTNRALARRSTGHRAAPLGPRWRQRMPRYTL
jgi:hypothetical protein